MSELRMAGEMPLTGRRPIWAAIAIAPLIAFLLLREQIIPDPSWSVPQLHFFVVSLTSLVALFMAALLVIAAGQLRDARVVFLSLAFLSIAGIFSVHGLTTPNALFVGMNPWVGFSSSLSLLVGSVFFALSTLDHHRHVQQIVVRRQALITVGVVVLLAGYAAVAFVDAGRGGMAGATSPDSAPVASTSSSEYASYSDDTGYGAAQTGPAASGADTFAFLDSNELLLATNVIALALFALMTVHYGRLYLRFPTPLLLSIALSSAFLLQAQLSMAVADRWKASWWEYHVLMLAAFLVVVVGLAMEYKQNGTLDGVVAGLLVRNTIDQLQRGYTEVIVALVNAVEAKDIYTRGHTQRVTDLSARIGEQMGLTPDRMRTLTQSAMLHDIGKIGVPDAILNKPGPLTDAEMEIVRAHPVRGYAIIKEVRSLRATLGGIRHHHERLDGSGYPDGLAGDDIPLEARIIAVADVFDALTSLRSYRDAWSVSRALAEIDAEAGGRLDPACVDALHRVIAAERTFGTRMPIDRSRNTAEAGAPVAARSMAD